MAFVNDPHGVTEGYAQQRHHRRIAKVVRSRRLRGELQHLGKGRLVYIEGRLQSRQWQATDGSTRRTVEIVANRLQALAGKSASAA